jgi:hypothetical protein
VIIVTQSLTKDMSSDVDLYRANAIRVLCRIIDVRASALPPSIPPLARVLTFYVAVATRRGRC